MDYIKKNSPFFIAGCVLLGLILINLAVGLAKTNGHFAYSLDDPYIHMAMAKNIVRHGVWGVTKHFFSSTSSSPLWTILLSVVYFITGVRVLTPFILNILIALTYLFWIYKVFLKESHNKIFLFITLTSIILFMSLPALVFMGLEHVLHSFLTLMFVYYSVSDICGEEKGYTKNFKLLLLLGPFTVMARYEALFLLFIVCCLYFLRRRFKEPLILFAVSVTPIVVFGLLSLSKGWYFFPNSVMLKGTSPDLSFSGIIEFFNSAFDKIIRNTYLTRLLVVVSLLAALIFKVRKTIWTKPFLAAVIYVFVLVTHVHFAGIGTVQRYVGYLTSMGIFLTAYLLFNYFKSVKLKISANLKSLKPKDFFIYITFFVFVFIMPYDAQNTYYSLFNVAKSTKNIYEQQYQMARFIKIYYDKQSVALNDIGAVNFYADVYCVDLWGLANMFIASERLEDKFSIKSMDLATRSKNAKLAIIYDGWYIPFFGALPKEWRKIAEWMIHDNVVCGGNVVAFYALSEDEAPILQEKLKLFDSKLPKTISRRYFSFN